MSALKKIVKSISDRTSQQEFFASQLKLAFHVLFVAAPMGVIVGLGIAVYDYLVNTFLWGRFVNTFSPEFLCLIPTVGMFLTGLVMYCFRVPSPSMADEVVKAYHGKEGGIDYKTAFPKLAASLTTMGFGASAGMEGASKWLGATITSFLQIQINKWKKLKILQGSVETSLLAGAAAGIGAIFRAPLTGAIMGVESPYKKDLAHESLIHGLVAAATSYATFILLRPNTPYFPIKFHYVLNYRDIFYSLILGLLAGLTSHLFLNLLYSIKRVLNAWKIHLLWKYLLGGLLLSLIAFISYKYMGEAATLHAGLPVANSFLNGDYTLHVCIFLFVAKLCATAITFGAGGVGGLFVPSATIGAALGAICDILFTPSQPGVFTLIGIAAFTGASYNSLLFAAVFVAEATGSPALLVPGLLASSVAFLVSSEFSNSPSQKKQRVEQALY